MPFILLLAVLELAKGQGSKVMQLGADNFEHRTQAATGQTTGTWLVHFKWSDCQPCQHVSNAMALYDIGEAQYPLIMAEVDAEKAPSLVKRFGITTTPAVLLFRDRKMYWSPDTAAGASEAEVLDSLVQFAQQPQGVAQPEEVPGESSQLAALLDSLKAEIEAALTNEPVKVALAGAAALGVGVAAVVMLTCTRQKQD